MNKSINYKFIINSLFLLLSCNFCYSQTDALPSITASGRQIFCPGNSINIVTDFTITDPDDTGIFEFFIQISSGYQIGLDRLELQGNHPSIFTNWSQAEGKLTLFSSTSTEILFSDLENAVKDIVLINSSTNSIPEKTFSFTIDNANYLPSTDHFYEFISAERITWQDAKVAAENRFFYGRRGYLATLTNQEEADFAGKQASGPGWIGGSDEEIEGEWKWVTGPEAGTVFWRGQSSGTTPNFAFWNRDEPNDFGGGEDYAHITDPSIGNLGSWNDLPNIGGNSQAYIPKGYIVEYGAPGDPPLNISASTSIYMPQITSITEATVCVSGMATISATASEGEIVWYEIGNIGNQPELARGNNFTTNVTETSIFYAAISINGCTTYPRTAVTITVNERPRITNTNDDIICSGTAVLSAESSAGDVYWYETATSTTPLFIGDNYQTPELFTTKSYFVEANIAGCTSTTRTEIVAEVDATIPSFNLSNDTYVLCKDIGEVDLEVINAQGNYRYIWKREGGLLDEQSSILKVTAAGNYSVTAVSEAGCISSERTIIVRDSEKSNLTKDDIIIVDDTNNNSIRVTNFNLGDGNYEFAIDDRNGIFTNTGFFDNLSTGIHTLYIKDRGGCGIQEYQFSILSYPKFFTPNGDGENDFWEINGYDKTFYTQTNIYIYNRFGNLIYTIEQNSQGWDGNYGGKKMPENSYWFRVVLTDINGYTIEKFGNLSLIR